MENKQVKITFDPITVIKDILKNIWVVLLSLLIGLMGVYILSRLVYPPVYVSQATLVDYAESDSNSTYTMLPYSMEMASIYSDVFTQQTMKDYAAKNIGEDHFDGTISTDILGKTNIFTVSVAAKTPDRAYTLLNSVLEVYPEISDTIFNNGNIVVLSKPHVPETSQSGLSGMKKIVIALGPMAIVLLLIALMSMFRDTVKNEDDFYDKIDVKLLGTVTHERPYKSVRAWLKKDRKTPMVNSVFTGFRFADDFQRMCTKLDYLRRHNNAKTFLISSVSEKEGKSTVAVNLSLSLAQRGYKVLLLDMNFLHPMEQTFFGVQQENSADLGDLLSGKIRPEEFKLTRFKKSNLYLGLNKIPHPDFPQWINGEYTDTMLAAFENIFDFIIMDTPPVSEATDVTGLMKLADRAILVVRTDWSYSYDINDWILKIGKFDIPFAGCVLNDVYTDFFGSNAVGEPEKYYKKYRAVYSDAGIGGAANTLNDSEKNNG